MKAMLLRHHADIATSPLRLTELPIPEPGLQELRVKVNCCGICRTDLHVIEGDLPAALRPLIPGHQVVGIVDKLGPQTHCFKIGSRIGIAWLRSTCGACRYCQMAKENLCAEARFTGYHSDGGFAEYAIIKEHFAYEIPEELKEDTAVAPLLCAGIIGYRALQRSQLPNGGRLGIYGFGSSAHIVMQLALFRGCEVYVITRDSKHQALAEAMGASWVGGVSARAPVKFDSAIVFAPAGELVPLALEALDKGGTLALAGIYMSAIPQLDYKRHLFYEKNVHSVTASTRNDGIELLRLAALIPIHPRITCFPYEQANEALQSLKNDNIQGSGVLVLPKKLGRISENIF